MKTVSNDFSMAIGLPVKMTQNVMKTALHMIKKFSKTIKIFF